MVPRAESMRAGMRPASPFAPGYRSAVFKVPVDVSGFLLQRRLHQGPADGLSTRPMIHDRGGQSPFRP